MTSFDLLAVIKEIKPKVANAHLVNVYQSSPNLLLLKLRTRDAESHQLLLEGARRIHLTNTRYKTPQLPPPFCKILRKHLRNGILTNLSQRDLDRLAILEVRNGPTNYNLIIELLDRGNIVLTDSKMTIIASNARSSRTNRPTAKGAAYLFPPIRGLDLQETTSEEAFKLIQKSNSDTVRSLVQFLNLPGEIAEEICIRAGVEKSKLASRLSIQEIQALMDQAKQLINEIEKQPLQPLLMRKSGAPESVVPVQLTEYRHLEKVAFQSFSDALDQFFREADLISRTRRENEATAKWAHVITEQTESADKLVKEATLLREKGALIFADMSELDLILLALQESKRLSGDWVRAIKTLEESESNPQKLHVQLIDPKSGRISLTISNTLLELDASKQAAANASEYYERAKEFEGKAKRALDALEETKRKLQATATEVVRERVEEKQTLVRKFWYERFRWFKSSEECLVVGGRDSSQNDTLIKKYIEPTDIIVHADIHGAPFVIIKSEQKPIGQPTLEEAAQFAVSYSSAWKGSLGGADAYWVKPDQVSKSAPSGEYIGKGAFMIRGEKNFFRGVSLGLSIGVQDDKETRRIIGGPQRAIRAQTHVFVDIVPGEIPAEKFAPQLRHRLSRILQGVSADEVRRLDDSEFIRFLPQGGLRFEKDNS
jgi:predicted ribosome quality control (RQC) complex YloA/Tae2 family protein